MELPSQQTIDQIYEIWKFIELLKSPLALSAFKSSMRVRPNYDKTADPQSRAKLHNVLEVMGNVHMDPQSLTNSSSAGRSKPIIDDPTHLEGVHVQIKALEESEPYLRQELEHRCAEELNEVKAEDMSCLVSVAEDDEILKGEMAKRQSGDCHTYIKNIASISAFVQYGDEVSGESQTSYRLRRNHYEGNIATDRARAVYGTRYGGRSVFGF